MIDKLYDEGIWFLKILGGEPFFRKDTPEIMQYAASKGIILSFSTNGSLVSSHVAATLARLRNSIIYSQMSLYGDNEASYERVTGSPKHFKMALDGLNRMVDHELDVTILVVATEDNCNRIDSYYEIARRVGVNEFRVTPKLALGRAADSDRESADEAPRMWARLIGCLKRIIDSGKPGDPELKVDARPQFASYLSGLTSVQNFYETCTAATTMIYIDPTGRSSPCPFLKQAPIELQRLYAHIGSEDITRKSFRDVWESPSFEKFRTYYDPKTNLFTINERCRYYSDGSCVPCVVTPCNCPAMIRSVKRELDTQLEGIGSK